MPEAMQAEQPEGFFQYLPPSQYDQVIGFSITDFGWTHIEPGMLYPPWQHPTEFSFTSTKGRLLDDINSLDNMLFGCDRSILDC